MELSNLFYIGGNTDKPVDIKVDKQHLLEMSQTPFREKLLLSQTPFPTRRESESSNSDQHKMDSFSACFTTGLGEKVEISEKEAQQCAKDLFASQFPMNSLHLSPFPSRRQSAVSDSSDGKAELQGLFFGTGNGVKIEVSAEAMRKANQLLASQPVSNLPETECKPVRRDDPPEADVTTTQKRQNPRFMDRLRNKKNTKIQRKLEFQKIKPRYIPTQPSAEPTKLQSLSSLKFPTSNEDPTFPSLSEMQETKIPCDCPSRPWKICNGVGYISEETLSLDFEPEFLERHFRLTAWKHHTLAVQLSPYRGHFTAEIVYRDLIRKYKAETEAGYRSVLRRINDKADFPNLHMVLCIGTVSIKEDEVHYEVTDGWYSVTAVGDASIRDLFVYKKLSEGMKIQVYAGNWKGGCISWGRNGIRRARWHARLGDYSAILPFKINLRSIDANGGTIPAIDVVIVQKYDVKYFLFAENERVALNENSLNRRDPEQFEKMTVKFLVKVKDTLNFIDSADKGWLYIQFNGAGDFYDDLRIGYRYKIYNLECLKTLKAKRKVLMMTKTTVVDNTNLRYRVESRNMDFDTAYINNECNVEGQISQILRTRSSELKAVLVKTCFGQVTVRLHDLQFFGNALANKLDLDVVITNVIKETNEECVTTEETQIKLANFVK